MKKSTFKRLFMLMAIIIFTSSAYAQMPDAISITPEGATAYDEITLTFNANLSCTPEGKDDLLGLTEIYMHSAAFELGQPAGWGNYGVDYNQVGANGQSPVLTNNGDDTYSITYVPYDFYGFPDGTVITQITAVFNGGSWDAEGKDFDVEGCKDFFIPLFYESGDPIFVFKCNMSKMIADGNYDPIIDLLYVDIEGLQAYEMIDLTGEGIYNVTVDEGLVLDQTYNFKFRINDDEYEDIDRQATAIGGTVTTDVWWNDDPIIPPAVTTLVVNMKYQALMGVFDPTVDFVDVAGSFNEWGGSGPMDDNGDTTYSIALNLDAGVNYEYKFRINADWNTSEFPGGGPNRILRGPATDQSIYHYYDNYNPAAWPVTFNVDMSAEIAGSRFDPETEYLDIAGSMNGWGGYSVLFDTDGDEIYSIMMFVDTAWSAIEFKFRIDGNWDNSEFPAGGPNRHYTAQDTAGGVVNIYDCIYNVIDDPMAPYAYDVNITGNAEVGEILTGAYVFFDPNGDAEGATEFQWYVATQPDGSDKVEIAGATAQDYTIVEDDNEKYLVFEVTPVAATGDPSVGDPKSAISVQVGTSSIDDILLNNIRIYPNPVENVLYVRDMVEVKRLEVRNLVGQLVASIDDTQNQHDISTDNWNSGLYFVVVYSNNNVPKTFKIVKE